MNMIKGPVAAGIWKQKLYFCWLHDVFFSITSKKLGDLKLRKKYLIRIKVVHTVLVKCSGVYFFDAELKKIMTF